TLKCLKRTMLGYP
ncbi:uncharacterized protein DMAD_08415, partial [Drosophila madeirensis]